MFEFCPLSLTVHARDGEVLGYGCSSERPAMGSSEGEQMMGQWFGRGDWHSGEVQIGCLLLGS